MAEIEKLYTVAYKGDGPGGMGSDVAVASSEVMDRDSEVIMQDGWDLENYKKAGLPIQADHSPSIFSTIGNAEWVKVAKDGNGNKVLLFKPKFHDATQAGRDAKALWDNNIVRTFSVGFIPHKWEDGQEDGEPRRRFLKQELLELTYTPVPSNPDAARVMRAEVAAAYKSGMIKDEKYARMLAGDEFEAKEPPKAPGPKAKAIVTYYDEEGKVISTKEYPIEEEVEKGAISYHDYGNADEGAAWDGPAAMKSDVDVLKKICAWYDTEKPDVKSSYKLPHHNPEGLKAVWRGVAAAMGALLGARGGASIPEGDKKDVYNHLAKHYKDFDKDAPDFKEYTEAELKSLFPDEDVIVEIIDETIYEIEDGAIENAMVQALDSDALKRIVSATLKGKVIEI